MTSNVSYETEIRLRIGDFDRYNRLLPSSVLDVFQEVATVQADNMGIGRSVMLEQGVFWAVVRIKYAVVAHPTYHSSIIAKTWPHSPSKYSFMRDYSLSSPDGKLYIVGSSEWVLMDFKRRTFASMKDHYHGPTNFLEERAFEDKLRKIKDFDTTDALTKTISPSFCDIDMNGHVNNSKYPNYVLDVINPGERGDIRSLQIDYRHEVLPGQPLEVFVHTEPDSFVAKGVNSEGAIAFAVSAEYDD